MGRRSEGYKLRQQAKGAPWSARWTIDGKRDELFTGEFDRAKADRVARQAYAEALQGRRSPRPGRGSLSPEVVARWLDDLPVRETTRGLYTKYSVGWLRELPRLDDASIAAYVRRRLREVQGKSLRSELSALRRLLEWMVETGELDAAPQVPRLDHSALGTPDTVRHRTAAPDYTENEIRKVLRALPEKSGRAGFWVRSRCELLYETGLRPSTIDTLSVPEHWARGEHSLRITVDIDKEGFARSVPLSTRARSILMRCAPKTGLIFGVHRYDHFIPEAARKALPPAKAAIFTPQHLRSARATHLLEGGAELPGVQYLLGHKAVSTTARYVRPTEAAAKRALSGRNSGRTRKG